MKIFWQEQKWVFATIFGSTVFALGFALFLQPNDMNAGGISGLAMVFVELTGLGSVGLLSILINLPLFLLGGLKIGRRFFAGSLLGMLLSSVLIDAFSVIPMPVVDPLIGVLYGGVLCGFGLGVVFVCGTSTGGSDILVRLLKLRYRNVPIGQISLCFDAIVVALTGLVFHDITKAPGKPEGSAAPDGRAAGEGGGRIRAKQPRGHGAAHAHQQHAHRNGEDDHGAEAV